MQTLWISVQRNLNIIGLKTIHDFLISNGKASTLLYLLRFDKENAKALQSLRSFIEDLNPGLIGISLTTIDFPPALALTELLRDWFPAIPIMWGGVHPTTVTEECVPHVDCVCRGEGEHVALDIVSALERGESIEHISNLAYLKEGKLHMNPLRPVERNLDVFTGPALISEHSYVQLYNDVEPFHMRHLKRNRVFGGSIYRVLIGRGCPMNCAYCCSPYLTKLYGDRKIRLRSVAHVMAELEEALEKGPKVNYITIADDCLFGYSKKYLEEFFSEYKKRIKKPFFAKATPSCVTDERIEMALDAGLAWLNVGLQSGSERVSKEVFKRSTGPDRFIKAAECIARHKVAAYYDVIIDNPFESEEEQFETIDVLMRTPKPYFLQSFSLTFYHKTALRERAERECPEVITDPATKDYYLLDKKPLNTFIVLVPTLHQWAMRLLMARYRRSPNGYITKILFSIALLYCHAVLEPIAYLRLMLRSQRGSILGVLRVLPSMIDWRLISYFNLFHTSKDTTQE